MKKILLSIFLFLMIISFSNAAAIPIINSYVTDNADVLSQAAKSELEKTLRDLEKSTNGVQFVVYIEKEYPKEYSLEEYALKIAETNKIGKKGNDNGILLYVAINDREYRWEVGYGVESTLNTPLLGRISREYIVPNFKQGNYEKGILEVINVTKRILLNSNDADIVALKKESSMGKFSFIFGIILVILIILILWTVSNSLKKLGRVTNTKRYKDSFYKGAAGGLFMSGFGRGGGGSFGGGFGGFSGGGGHFGGGGFSGRF